MYAVIDFENRPPLVTKFEGVIEDVRLKYKTDKVNSIRVVATDAQANSLKEKWGREYENRQRQKSGATAAPN